MQAASECALEYLTFKKKHLFEWNMFDLAAC